MKAEDLQLPVADGRVIDAHLATPDDATNAPAVLVMHEVFGLTPDIKAIAHRFAEEGYVALAPDSLFGLGPKPVCVARCMRQIHSGEGPVVRDALVARDWLVAHTATDGRRVGVIGFCMGGGFALLLGSLGGFGAAAPFYGQSPSDERVKELCPVVGGYGGSDRYFAWQGRRLKARLQQLGIAHDIEVYDGVGHSFMTEQPDSARPLIALSRITPFRWGHDPEAAADSWRRVLGFFEQHL